MVRTRSPTLGAYGSFEVVLRLDHEIEEIEDKGESFLLSPYPCLGQIIQKSVPLEYEL